MLASAVREGLTPLRSHAGPIRFFGHFWPCEPYIAQPFITCIVLLSSYRGDALVNAAKYGMLDDVKACLDSGTDIESNVVRLDLNLQDHLNRMHSSYCFARRMMLQYVWIPPIPRFCTDPLRVDFCSIFCRMEERPCGQLRSTNGLNV